MPKWHLSQLLGLNLWKVMVPPITIHGVGPLSSWWRWIPWSPEWFSHPPSWEAWHYPDWWYGWFMPHGPWVLVDALMLTSLSSRTWWTWPPLTSSLPSYVASLKSCTSSLSPPCRSSGSLFKGSGTPHMSLTSCLSFRCIHTLFRVWWGFMVVAVPWQWNTQFNASDRPFM